MGRPPLPSAPMPSFNPKTSSLVPVNPVNPIPGTAVCRRRVYTHHAAGVLVAHLDVRVLHRHSLLDESLLERALLALHRRRRRSGIRRRSRIGDNGD